MNDIVDHTCAPYFLEMSSKHFFDCFTLWQLGVCYVFITKCIQNDQKNSRGKKGNLFWNGYRFVSSVL